MFRSMSGKAVFALLLGLGLGACNQYTTQICTPDKRTDTPSLAGVYKSGTQPLTLVRKGVGEYENQLGKTIYYCEFSGDRLIIEWAEKNPDGFALAYAGLGVDKDGVVQTLTYMDAAFDEETLKKAAIQYSSFDKEYLPGSKTGVINVENGALSAENLLDLLRPSVLRAIRYVRQ